MARAACAYQAAEAPVALFWQFLGASANVVPPASAAAAAAATTCGPETNEHDWAAAVTLVLSAVTLPKSKSTWVPMQQFPGVLH